MATLNTKATQSALQSHAQAVGGFDSVALHEPRKRPNGKLHVALWCNGIITIPASGLGSVSARVEWLLRLYTPGEQEPQDDIDVVVIDAADALISSLCGDFTLDDHLNDGLVRMIDVLGAHGPGLSAVPGWARWSDGSSRVVTITIPEIVNDVWQLGG